MNPRYRRLLIPGLLVALIVVAVIASLRKADAAEDSDPPATIVGTITDSRLAELSGWAFSRNVDGHVYAINDSGSAAEVYLVEVASGDVVGTTQLSDVDWLDPEALAIDDQGRLWVADTGDNNRSRDDVSVYLFDDPGPGEHQLSPVEYAVTLPGGSFDIEAMTVRDQELTLFSKGLSGSVFRAEITDTDRSSQIDAERMAEGLPGAITDAAISADGSRAFVLSYRAITELDPTDWSVAQSFGFPTLPQAEALAIDPTGKHLIVGTEGLPAPIIQVDLPAPVEGAEQELTDATPTADEPIESADDQSDRSLIWLAAGGAVALLATVFGWRMWSARRR